MNGYEYRAVFTNVAGIAVTQAAILFVSPASPPPSPTLSPVPLLVAISIDSNALTLLDFPPALSFLNALSEQWLGQPLPPTVDLIPTIEGDIAAMMNLIIGTVESDIAAMMNLLHEAF